MPARASWKGFLQVNQLSFGVKAFSACSAQPEIQLKQLHRGCGERVRQQKICPVHGVLRGEQIIHGFEFDRGRYLPIEPAELESLAPDDGKAIEVHRFVPSTCIDAVFHSGRTYYLTPDGPPSQRPFAVLREGMRSSDRHGVAQVVIAGRELLVLLRPLGKLVAMTVLLYPQRIRPASDYETEAASISPGPGEQELVQMLIAAMSDERFELSCYHDRYLQALGDLIAKRLAEQAEEGAGGGALDDEAVVAALRASLAGVREEKPPRPLMSPSRRGDSVERKLG